ncbi:tRNA pseudouridine(38-40) synthase TruA [Xylanivirga thermophila]|uniref:tRNA pseudouridine(38-40) synthase TruA n=1 Tax=Xylanivirga thermophila TaxID=2496273 RepID=UPI00101D3C7F|nr:tRNA pseudouridine(38-40) synthase TruA [Xylanivirga thermophila]
MKNIKLIVEYDGTNYGGWQRQKNAPSIQKIMEDGIYALTGEEVDIIASGRTDSGVHARGQVVNFKTSSTIPPERFSYALNAMLPSDIRIKGSMEVPESFHARYDAAGKHYSYSIISSQQGIAIGRQYYYHIRGSLDVSAMEEAAKHFVGTYDFSAFRATGGSVKTSIRTIYKSYIEWREPYIYYHVTGSGFLYNMVRIIVGTLIDVGRHKLRPDDIHSIIDSKDRNMAGPTAPPHGLCLEEVYYKKEDLL